MGLYEPMLLICAPGLTCLCSKTGSQELVAVQMISQLYKSSAFSAGIISEPVFADIFLQKEIVFCLFLANTKTFSIALDPITPSICISACSLEPKIPRTFDSCLESNSAASPDAAPVLRAVKYTASRIAIGSPVSLLIITINPCDTGKLRNGL